MCGFGPSHVGHVPPSDLAIMEAPPNQISFCATCPDTSIVSSIFCYHIIPSRLLPYIRISQKKFILSFSIRSLCRSAIYASESLLRREVHIQ
ncbi:hypothetical protein L2E82_22272 [Cichorium intybus]|uniref:Uncharacterized protein n=1 Tax=Cichorium intybus TaxID=13427 RepID=A0ACB9DWX1_CICIN|nr:hypothetical protein L2E82_22272 [Cichorium intybus]